MNEAVALADALLAELKQRPEIYMVGIAGIPGSGKSTLARALAGRVPGAVVIAMDGYHIPRSRLDAEGLRRRGAAHIHDRVGRPGARAPDNRRAGRIIGRGSIMGRHLRGSS